MNRMRGGLGGGSSSSGGFGSGLFGQNNESSSKVKYECLVCHKVYNARECPRCGSTMKRAMFQINYYVRNRIIIGCNTKKSFL